MPFVIDIDPVAFSLIGIPVRWYGLILVGAVAVAVWLAQREGRRRGIESQVVADAAIWAGGAALVGGRVLYVVQNELGSLADHPTHLLMVWMGGLSFYGGLIGALLALVVFARRRGLSVLAVFDIAAPAAAIGQAIGHLGCLIGGDSYGLPTDLSWAVIYRDPGAMAPKGIALHPTQAYEAILLGVLFVALWLGRERLGRLGTGVVAGSYLLGLAAVRFGLFYLRDEPTVLFGLKTAQLIGLGIAGLAIVLFIAARHARGAMTLTGWNGPIMIGPIMIGKSGVKAAALATIPHALWTRASRRSSSLCMIAPQGSSRSAHASAVCAAPRRIRSFSRMPGGLLLRGSGGRIVTK